VWESLCVCVYVCACACVCVCVARFNTHAHSTHTCTLKTHIKRMYITISRGDYSSSACGMWPDWGCSCVQCFGCGQGEKGWQSSSWSNPRYMCVHRCFFFFPLFCPIFFNQILTLQNGNSHTWSQGNPPPLLCTNVHVEMCLRPHLCNMRMYVRVTVHVHHSLAFCR